jgi:uncharacterized membrane protein
MKKFLAHARADFLAGLAVVLPVAVSFVVAIWLFGAVSHLTDALLLLVPMEWIRSSEGALHLYSRVLALLVALLLVVLVGRLGRYYFGKKLIQGVDLVLVRVPLLNRLYTGSKQIHEAFTSNKSSAFKQVVLVEFPRPGLYSLGFITGLKNPEAEAKTQQRLLGVFVPTPPLTSGSVILVPESQVVRLDMSVADGLKFIMSLGSVSPTQPFAVEGSIPSGLSRSREAKGTLASLGPPPKLAQG